MSMPKVRLHVQAIPKTLVRVGVAGDFVKNLSLGSLSDTDIRNIQQAVAEGLIARIAVTGIDANSIPRERFWLRFDPLTDDAKVMLDLENGKSTIEAVDVGMAGGVAAAVQILRRKALRPQVSFDYSADAMANPSRLAEAKRRLGFVDLAPLQPVVADQYRPAVHSPHPAFPSYGSEGVDRYMAPLPAPPPGFGFRNVAKLTPAKDTGIQFGWDSLRRL